jgi:hypothetical protein
MELRARPLHNLYQFLEYAFSDLYLLVAGELNNFAGVALKVITEVGDLLNQASLMFGNLRY